MFGYHLPPWAEPWIAAILCWIGLATVAGLAARAMVPSNRPVGPWATLCIGMVGCTVGPALGKWLWPAMVPSPLSPGGMACAILTAAGILGWVQRYFAADEPDAPNPSRMSATQGLPPAPQSTEKHTVRQRPRSDRPSYPHPENLSVHFR